MTQYDARGNQVGSNMVAFSRDSGYVSNVSNLQTLNQVSQYQNEQVYQGVRLSQMSGGVPSQFDRAVSNNFHNFSQDQADFEFKRHLRLNDSTLVNSMSSEMDQRVHPSVHVYDTRQKLYTPQKHDTSDFRSKRARNVSVNYEPHKIQKKSGKLSKRNFSEISTDIDESYGSKYIKVSEIEDKKHLKPNQSNVKLVEISTFSDHVSNEVYNMTKLDLGTNLDDEKNYQQMKSRLRGMMYSSKTFTEESAIVVPSLPSFIYSSNL